MDNVHALKYQCDQILTSLLGKDLVAAWWQRPNLALGNVAPEAIWQTDPVRVYQYLAAAAEAEG
jgi:hypothetical protein